MFLHLLTRSLFSKKARDAAGPSSPSEPGWRLFGRDSPKQIKRVLKVGLGNDVGVASACHSRYTEATPLLVINKKTRQMSW